MAIANYAEYNGATLINNYITLEEAFEKATSGNTIKVVNGTASSPIVDASTASPTVASGKNLKLDMNGKTIELSNTLTNNETLFIYNSSSTEGKINSSANVSIKNSGTLTMIGTASANNVTVTNTTTAPANRILVNDSGKTATLYNNVTLIYNTAIVQPATAEDRYVVDNNGILNISGATITNTISDTQYDKGIVNNNAGSRIAMTAGNITTTGDCITNNSGTGTTIPTVKISGTTAGTTITSNRWSGISQYATGTIKVNGGSITGKQRGIYSEATSEIIVTGGTITGTNNDGIRGYTGNVTVSGSSTNITGKTYGISVRTGSITVTEGTVTATGGIGVYAGAGNQGVTLGNNANAVDTRAPAVTGTTYGVQVLGTGNLNFYDGIVKGAENQAISVGGEVVTPQGYGVQKTNADGKETAILVIANYAEYDGDTLVSNYTTLAEAFEKAKSGNTIKVLNGTESSAFADASTTSPTVASGKTLTLDLNEKVMTIGQKITNNGTLTVTSLTSGGKLSSSANFGIDNLGTGTVSLLGGTIEKIGTGTAVYNESTGEIVVNGGTINHKASNGAALNNKVGGTITVISGTVESTSQDAIYNQLDGTVDVRGGTIKGKNGIYCVTPEDTTKKATVTITGGSIEGKTEQGVRIGIGTATIGTKEATPSVNTAVPSITGYTNGISVSETGTLNIYDGVFVGKSGLGSAITGTISEVQSGYGIQKTLSIENIFSIENTLIVETVILVKANYAEYNGASLLNNYVTLAEAFEKAASGNTIKVLNGTASSAFADESTTSPTVASGKTLTLDLNEKNMTINKKITNNGTLTVTSSTSEGKLSSSANFGIDNLGTGTVSLLGGTIEKIGTGTAVYNESTGEIVVNGGTINHKASNGAALNNKVGGTITVISGTVESTSQDAIYNQLDGTVDVRGGTIKGKNGIYCVTPEDTTKKATVTITGGSIEGKTEQGVRIGIGTATIGTKEATPSVNTAVPSITGYTNGISVSETGTLNIYDGVFVGKSGEGSAITGNVSEVQSGYAIQKTLNTENTLSVETAILVKANYAEYNGASLVNNYETLADAFENATSGNTIKPLSDRTSEAAATLASGKTVTLDLNGKTITMTGNLTNAGTLTINGSGKVNNTAIMDLIKNSGTLTLAGSVEVSNDSTSTSNKTVYNTGTVIVDGATVNSEEYIAIYNDGTSGKVEVKSGTVIAKNKAIQNKKGTANTTSSPAVKISGGIVESTGYNAIWNDASGMVYITGGTVTSNSRTIWNNGTGKIKIEDGNIISTGTIVGTVDGVKHYNPDTVVNQGSGSLEVSGGTITCERSSSGIAMGGTGSLTVTGGTITGISNGIWVTSSNTPTITIGNNSDGVSITSPKITGTTNGIATGTGKIYFYDGIITGATDKAITESGTVTNATNCVTVKTNANGKQTAVNGPSAPTITAKLSNSSGATYTSGDWTNKDVWVSLTSSKVGSGISKYQWYENGAWTTRGLSTTGNTGEITYTADRNLTIRFRAVDTNGVASEEATYTIRREAVEPTITVSPASATACTSKSVTITAADTGGSGLSSSNSYQYYLSTSSTALQGGSWTNYTSGTAFTLGSGKNGTFYLFVKRVRDNAGNVSTANGTEQTVGGTTYQRFGTYVFAQNYTVTADANGGTIPATTGWTVASGSKTATKSVSYNSTYGTLPTPTRTGYTFLGWSGKNLFNKDATPVSTSKYIKGDGTLGTSSEYSVYQVCVKPNTTYTITNSGKSTAPGYAIYNASGERVDGANYANKSVVTFTTPATAVYMKFSVVTLSTSNRYDKETFQLEENSAATAYEAYYVVDSSTKVTKTANHTITAQWSINEYNLTINPNGGTYDGSTSNTTVTKHYGTYYGLNTPTNSNAIFADWTNSGSGTLLRGDASGKPDAYDSETFTKTEKTDADGSQYTNFTYNKQNTGTGTIYSYIRYSKYSFTPGHTYRISLDLRINSYSGLGNFELRHACIENDYSSTGRVAKRVASSAAGQGWINYTMDRTWSDTTIESANKASNVAINPLFEIYTSIPAGNTGVVDFDIRNIVIEDITDNTTVSNGTYDGYVYRFGNGNGSVTAQWEKAMFDTGMNVNAKMKQLAGNSSASYMTADASITSFEHYTGVTPVSTENNVSVSSIPIYMWFDNGTIYWWSEDSNPYLNEDSSWLFSKCSYLENIDVSEFDTSRVSNMSGMFSETPILIIDASGFDTSNVTNMSGMFFMCLYSVCIDISGFDTSNVREMNSMFYNCSRLKTIYASNLFNTDNVTSSSAMFRDCTSLVGGSGTTFNSSYIDKTYAHIDGGTSNPGYFTAKSTTNSAPQSLSLNSVNTLKKLSIKRNTLTNSISTEDTQTSTDVENTSENINNTETIDTNESNDNVLVELPKTVQLNGTNYPSISEAIAAANKGETIKLLEDISLTDEVIIEEGKEVIINLNGKTLTSTSNNTINNAGTLTITGAGIVRNEVENGNVIYNTGILNIENGVITTDKNGGKAVYNSSDYSKYDQVKEVTVVGGEEKEELRNAITFNMKGGKIVTEGIGSIGIYNAKNNRGVITGGIVEVRKSASTGIYNDSELEISDAKVVVADYDATGIYNSDSASICELKGTELTIEAEEIENYELIKNTDQFKAELEEMKPSYGVYNDSKSLNVVIETAVIKAERLKSVAIMNAS